MQGSSSGSGVFPTGRRNLECRRRYALKRDVVHKDGRGLRVSDDIYQSSQAEVERLSDQASVTDRSHDPARRETKLSHLCGLDTPSILDSHHIFPREYQDTVCYHTAAVEGT